MKVPSTGGKEDAPPPRGGQNSGPRRSSGLFENFFSVKFFVLVIYSFHFLLILVEKMPENHENQSPPVPGPVPTSLP